MSSVETAHYDIFISYSRDDGPWVREHLYERLRHYRTPERQPPRVFFDEDPDSIRLGQNFMQAIVEAIRHSKKIVPVYSKSYFEKEMTMFELRQAHLRDVNGTKRILLPILIHPEAADQVPLEVQLINWVACDKPDWFERLLDSLELSPAADALQLEFQSQPGDVFANHTLPVVRVVVNGLEAVGGDEQTVALKCEGGELQGTTTVRTEEGVATFADLSVGHPVQNARLVASTHRLGPVFSEPFTVHESPTARIDTRSAGGEAKPASAVVRLSATGEVEFFASGRALAVISPDGVRVFDRQGELLSGETPIPLGARIRCVRRRGSLLALAEWAGTVHLLGEDGRHQQWSFAHDAGFAVPADVDIVDDQVYVGLWNGAVYRLAFDADAKPVLRDENGVQALGVYGDRIFTCDFDGSLRIHHRGRVVNTKRLERTVWMLRDCDDCLLAVGDERFYHITGDGSRIIDFELPVGRVAAVYETSRLPVVIDDQGKGIRFDKDLIVRARIHTRPGAVPVSADDDGTYCVFCNPDGSRSLLVGNRIVFSQRQGTLAVSPDACLFAIDDGNGLALLDADQFKTLLQDEPRQ